MPARPRRRRRDLVGVPHGYPFDSVLRGVEQALGRSPRVHQRLRDNRLIEQLVASSDALTEAARPHAAQTSPGAGRSE